MYLVGLVIQELKIKTQALKSHDPTENKNDNFPITYIFLMLVALKLPKYFKFYIH